MVTDAGGCVIRGGPHAAIGRPIMPTEIERKFLVTGPGWTDHAGLPVRIRQAYLAITGQATVRVRIKGTDAASLAVKSAAPAVSRIEVEAAIPVADAEELLALRHGVVIEKQRYPVPFEGLVWEVDVFAGENQGLVIAEVELPDEGHAVQLPPWVGEEVTADARYYNAQLANAPIRGS